MPTAARQNMLPLAASVKVYYKRNTILVLIELKCPRLLILQNKELFWFLLLILYPHNKKKSKGHQSVCVFFLVHTFFRLEKYAERFSKSNIGQCLPHKNKHIAYSLNIVPTL